MQVERIKRKNEKVDAILTADWHLREDKPIGRIDDFEQTQWDKVSFVSDLQKEHNCPVLHSGDLFHHWKPSPALLSKTIERLPSNFHTVYGNHDLPQHNLDLADKCGIYTLSKARVLNILDDGNWETEPENGFTIKGKVICVWHIMTYKQDLPFPGCTASSAKRLLKKHPNFDLIVTGDNHVTFTETYENQLLVNPGSLTRQTASQIEHRPCVFLWYAATNTVKPVYLPIKTGVISREHLVLKEKRDDRISAFVSKLNTEYATELSFEENLEKFKQVNQIRTSVMELIYKAIEPIKI